MYTLIIFVEIPEHNNFYLIPNDMLTEEQIALLEQANNVLTNADDSNDGTTFVSMALLSEEHRDNASDYGDKFIESACIFAPYKLGNDKLPMTNFADKPITRVIFTGWVM